MSRVTVVYDTPGEYRFTVPAGVTSVRIEAYGATGGNMGTQLDASGNYNTGRVGYAAGDFTAVPGDVLYIEVGGAGGAGEDTYRKSGIANHPLGGGNGSGKGGFNGGGPGGTVTYSTHASLKYHTTTGCGGGGASDVRLLPNNQANTLASRILVAGGQGGDSLGVNISANSANPQFYRFTLTANPTSPSPPYNPQTTNWDFYSVFTNTPGVGGFGGGLVGGNGGWVANSKWAQQNGTFTGGFGGGQTAGGKAGAYSSSTAKGSNAANGSNGALGVGGAGGNLSTAMVDNATWSGGGGGGGYYGGGGGATSRDGSSVSGGGGGGGSNYVLSATMLAANAANGLGRDVAPLANTVQAAHTWHGKINPTSGAKRDPLLGGVVLSSADAAALDNYTLPFPTPGAQDGRVMLTYTVPPTAKVSKPLASAQFDPAAALPFTWVFSSLDPEATQGGYAVAYRPHSGGSWTLLTSKPAGGAVFTYSVPAHTFTAGSTYDLGVMVWDSTGLGAADYAYVVIDAKQSTAVLGPPASLSPAAGATVASSFNVTWTLPTGVSNEADYQVQVLNADGDSVLDTGQRVVQRLNLIPNPSAETDVSLWQVSSGGGTLSQNTNATYAKIGTKSFKMVWAAVDSPYVAAWWTAGSVGIPTIPGEVYQASIWVTDDNATRANAPTIALTALNTDGTVVSSSPAVDLSAQSAGVWVRLALSFTAASSRTLLAVSALGLQVASVTTYFDAAIMERRSSPDTLTTTISGDGAYFDGANYTNGTVAGTASWVGTANLSPSKFVPTAGNVLSQAVSWTKDAGAAVLRFRLSAPDYAAWANKGTISVGSGGGNFCPWQEVDFFVNPSPPTAPTVSLAPNNDAGTITVTIAGGSGVTFCDVYRTDVTNGGDEIRVATGLAASSTWVDYTPATGVVYAYRVRAFSTTGGYVDVS